MNNINFDMINSLNNLLSGYNIKATCVDAKQHRHFSYYDLKLDFGTKINNITQYASEFSLFLKTKTNIVVTPISENGIVRLYTTHANAEILDLNKMFQQYTVPKDALLPFLFGETAEGNPLWIDMAKNPHLLIAGSTGSGKSVTLHTIIRNVTERNDIKLLLIDTKRVEFNVYRDSIFNNLVQGIAENYNEAIGILRYVYMMMESRYNYMSNIGIQSIEEKPNIFYKMIIIIDEIADLMLHNKNKEFEQLVVKIAQKARAAGIYLVLATQRPSSDVITGLIKSNFPARLSCKVSTKTDSRIILDKNGAENLAGKGDAIIKHPFSGEFRFQVGFVKPKETINHYKQRYN